LLQIGYVSFLDTTLQSTNVFQIAKQEEWEEKTKLGSLFFFHLHSFIHAFSVANQFRALEEDEIMFLDSIRERQEEEERQRKEKDGEEVKNFKEYVRLSDV